ncbi:hypothetical protein Tco_1379856, partial [Tanacetum coccineum]
SSLRSQNQSLVNQVHELETLSAGLREKLETYEGSMKQLEEFQDNLMKPLEARLAEIDADFTGCCMHIHENFHLHLLNAIAGRRWLLTHGMKLLMAKCLNSTEYMEALRNAFGRAIEKGMHEGLAHYLFRDWVRSFGISFASLSFSITGSLESLEVSLFWKFRLSFSVGLSRYFALAP